jgi:hypothetical protein
LAIVFAGLQTDHAIAVRFTVAGTFMCDRDNGYARKRGRLPFLLADAFTSRSYVREEYGYESEKFHAQGRSMDAATRH